MKLYAGRHEQLINLTEIGTACGISHTTLSEWLNLLELSYILFRLPPYHKNFNKRLVKNSKLFFARAKAPNIYFWNSHKVFEIDLLIEQAGKFHAIEIKSSATYSNDFTKQLKKWQALDALKNNDDCFVVYAGYETLTVNGTNIIPYKEIHKNIVKGL